MLKVGLVWLNTFVSETSQSQGVESYFFSDNFDKQYFKNFTMGINAADLELKMQHIFSYRVFLFNAQLNYAAFYLLMIVFYELS